MGLTLYELTGTAADLAELLERPDLAAEDRLVANVLQAELLENLLPAKVEAYCHIIAQLRAEADAFAKEAARLSEHAHARAGEADRLKARLHEALAAAGVDRLKAGVWAVGLQASPPAVKITDEQALPAEFWRQPAPQIDRAALADKLKTGEAVPGAELAQSKHLRIR